MFNITLLSENTSDCLFVTVGAENNPTHILIDGGLTADQSELVDFCKNHFDHGKTIDLVILSHVDGDHIGGLLHLFKQDFVNPNFVKQVWFNSKYPSGRLGVKRSPLNITYGQGNRLSQLLVDKGIPTSPVVASSSAVPLSQFCEIEILAPSQDALAQMLNDWPTDKNLGISAERADHSVDWDVLRAMEYPADGSKKNRSSVVVIIRCLATGKKALFTGDSVPSEILNSLDALPEKLDLVKLPHHGSKKNINRQLVAKFPSSRYLITAGPKDIKPHKKSIQLLIDNLSFPFELHIAQGNWVEKLLKLELRHYGCTVQPFRSKQIIEL